MNLMSKNHKCLKNGLILCSALAIAATVVPLAAAHAQSDRPSLIITSEPVPEALRKQVYSKPARVRDITSDEVAGRGYYRPTQTPVTSKIAEINADIGALQDNISLLSQKLNVLQRDNESTAATYYAAVATISAQLQSGTTPGNPRLTQKLSDAEGSLEHLGSSITLLNQLASDLANSAGRATYLLEATQAAYGLSGAVEEDHIRLAELEDSVHNTTVIIERMLNTVSDDITRTGAYLSSERNNMRTLSLAVTNGDLFGRSLANRAYNGSPQYQPASLASGQTFSAQNATASAAPLQNPRPLIKIRFDRADVNYEQPVYAAVNEALERFPNARFDIVAVNPTKGNAAQVAIESTRARRNAERVLRTLTQMGLPLERIDLSYNQSDEATTSEVHIFIR